jgi:hypothetical protein
VIPLILGTRAVIEDEKVVRRHRLLSLALIVLLAAIMTSAMLRMRLYVGYFGLTTDRLYATALMLWLALVSLALARTVLRGWSRPFAAMTVLSGFATLFALNIANPHLLVARVNLARSSAERSVDLVYLARLGGDATPTVVKALNAAVPSAESCAAARSLRARLARQEYTPWNLGGWRGREAIEKKLPHAEELRLCVGVPETNSQGARVQETTPPPQ